MTPGQEWPGVFYGLKMVGDEGLGLGSGWFGLGLEF